MATENNNTEFMQRPKIPTLSTAKELVMFFIVDISGSMMGERIDAVNEAFTKMIGNLRQIQLDCQNEYELKIAIITFAESAQWLVTPTPILEYNHDTIKCTPDVTFYSKAFMELESKLNRSAYLKHTGKLAAPYIMFLTDGFPSSGDDYKTQLKKLKENTFFEHSSRFAVLIGESAINNSSAREAVKDFVADPVEGIINAENAVKLTAVIQANTLHTVAMMTHYQVPGGNGSGNSSPNPNPNPAPNPDPNFTSGFDWGTADPSTIFGGNMGQYI